MEIERLRILGTNTESYSVNTTEDLSNLTKALYKSGRVNGVGYDVFGTLLTSLYTRTQQSAFLAKQVEFYHRRNLLATPGENVAAVYERVREEVKAEIHEHRSDAPAKEIECPEANVIAKVDELFRVPKIDSLVSFVQKTWPDYNVKNTKPISEMLDIIKKSVEIFGQDRVGVFTNNS